RSMRRPSPRSRRAPPRARSWRSGNDCDEHFSARTTYSRYLPLKGGGRRMRFLRASTAGIAVMTVLRIVSAGPGAPLQDGGRHGYLRFGVTAAGPMDPLAFATANAAAGAERDATAIEVSLGGVELAADTAVSVAIAGGAFRIEIDGRVLPHAAVATLEPRRELAVRPA